MFTSINTISGISSKLGNLARTARSKTVLAAAVATISLGIGSSGFAVVTAPTDVTSITTQFTAGTPYTVPGTVTGAGTTNVSPFYPQTNKYTMTYANDDSKIVALSAGGTTYNPIGMGSAVVRRSTGKTNDTVWEVGTGGAGSSTVSAEGMVPSGYNQVLAGNNILMGADNVFSNMGNSVGNNTNVVRVDLLFTAGIKSSTSTAFSVMDRGPTTDHDSFKIAAITALDVNGNPSNYGTLYSMNDGQWGKTSLAPTQQEDILRKDVSVPNDNFHPSDITGQTLGGVLIPTSYLASAGSTIYGYSIFSAAAKGSGTQLVNWTNSTYFPSADSTSTGGGLDPVATLGVEYTSAVPEPATLSVVLLGAGGLIARRPKRNRV